jgi:2-methylaconitate cis-trans-isomerase PrpF
VRGSRCGGNEIEHPTDPAERDDLLLRILGSPEPRQIDGLGGAHPLTSKVAIVSRAKDADADIDFLFAQVGVDKALVDTTENCGNTLAGLVRFIRFRLVQIRFVRNLADFVSRTR